MRNVIETHSKKREGRGTEREGEGGVGGSEKFRDRSEGATCQPRYRAVRDGITRTCKLTALITG